MANPYRFKIGETAVVALEAVGGSDAELANITITAVLKVAQDGSTVPPLDTPDAAVFACAFRRATDAVGPGWNLTLTSVQSAGLAAGTYVTNAVLTFADGTIQKTDPLFFTFAVATQ